MSIEKQAKDRLYELLKDPILETLREFLRLQSGEHDNIDFKKEWIEDSFLAKEILAMANTKGGIILFGVQENNDGTMHCVGLNNLKDKVNIHNSIKNYISPNLKYEVYDFSYDSSEYEAIQGKKFQLLIIEDTPEYIPFLAKKEGSSLKKNLIYVRKGTACELAEEEDVEKILLRRMNYQHPSSGHPLSLNEHLEQLKILYQTIDEKIIHYSILPYFVKTASALSNLSLRKRVYEEKNPHYPDDSYDKFISDLILKKKKKIERVLDLS